MTKQRRPETPHERVPAAVGEILGLRYSVRNSSAVRGPSPLERGYDERLLFHEDHVGAELPEAAGQ
jgi:hypothetical protein